MSTNTKESLAPIFIFRILKESGAHMAVREIQSALLEHFDIAKGEHAIRHILLGMSQTDIHIYCSKKDGKWFFDYRPDYGSEDLFETDEEIDEDDTEFATRSGLAPLFVDMVLQDAKAKPALTQEEIIRKVADYPYCLPISRQTVSRIINTMDMAA